MCRRDGCDCDAGGLDAMEAVMIEEASEPFILRCTCQPPSDEQLDRTLCACGHMHFYCECGLRTDDCPLD